MTQGVQLLIEYDLVNAGDLTPSETRRREERAVAAFLPACGTPYAQALTDALNYASKAPDVLRAVYNLPSYARVLDETFSVCVAAYGVEGHNLLTNGSGRTIRVPDYLESFLAYGERVIEAKSVVADEQQKSAEFFTLVLLAFAAAGQSGSYINPDQLYVGSYLRQDETWTRGHWRTNQNWSCLDNINGC